ncbi:unnamed protein product [Rhizophagus irregularis]|uniref:Uncharacterized protein n=1 Tax=Rhizophagus irregularis TaxID=588596 RepID=A0A916E625_9GLOM|nr:unnamed protein product [Rhizophagus irregularis]CAB5362504.1 unnamed protein product [Rhizophagus irregularis]
MNPANNDELFNEYESLEGNLVADEDLVDKDEVFYTYDENYEDISDIENNNNNEPLFELDFNTLTKVKQFTQQNTSDEEDESITSDTESNFSESESDEEHDEIITQLKDKQELSPCVIIDVFEVRVITQLNQEKSNNTSDILIPLADTKTEISSLFIILIILALMKFNYNLDKKLNPKNLTPKNFFEFGEALAHSTILAKNELKLHKKSLESPISIEEYCASFPLCLVQFYNGLLETLYKTKKKIID